MALEPTDKLVKMIQYVEQEGYEKADEIDAKTQDEFNMEKKRLIKQECLKIDEEFLKKRANCKKRHIVDLTMMTSSSRKDLIREKQNEINILLGQIKEIVAIDMKCPTGRWTILELLTLEGLFKLMEEKVVIRCRKQDASIMEKYLPDLVETFFEKTNLKVTLKVDSVPLKDDPLPSVVLLVKRGQIILNNSLRDRIDQVFTYFIPVISSIFYETKKLDASSFSIVNFY